MGTSGMVLSRNQQIPGNDKEYVMTCETYRDFIAAHVDGSLALAERQEAEHHLADCKNCSRLFADQQRLRQITRTWHREVPIPVDVEHRLRVAIAAENTPLLHWW